MDTQTAVAPAVASAAVSDRAPAAIVPSRALYRYAIGVVVAVIVLLKLGANVTSTGSGMAFQDWPLANGSLWPPHMKLAGLFEHGHRVFASFVGLLILGMAIWIQRRDPRRWMHRLGWGLFGLVCLQGVIGGVGVLEHLPAITSVSHGVLGQVILCLTVLVAFAVSPAWRTRVVAHRGQVTTGRRFAAIAVVLVFLQLLVGAILRHTNAQGMLWLHVFMAIGVALWITITAMYCGATFQGGFRTLSKTVLGVLVLQLTLGFITLVVRHVKDPSNIQYLGRSLLVSAHVVVGALLFSSAALLLYRCARNVYPAEVA